MSETPGTCQTEDCDNWGEDLEECVCKDGKHENFGLPQEGENAAENEE